MRAIKAAARAGTNARKARFLEAGASQERPIAITTGANLERARTIAMMMTHGRSDAVLETSGTGQTGTDGIGTASCDSDLSIRRVAGAEARPTDAAHA